LEASSGPTCFRDEGGFSAVTGEVLADTPELVQQLEPYVSNGQSVTVRCGQLEACGTLAALGVGNKGRTYRLRLQAVRFGPPGSVA
jgi:hypothetical protein